MRRELRSIAWATLVVLAAVGCSGPSTSQDPPPREAEPAPVEHTTVGAIALYLPNRIFDILDIVRARVRGGPGLTLSLRATELADVNLGGHGTVFVGLPGPRGHASIPWPIGLEAFAGVEVSVIDATQEKDEHAPNYGAAEVGLGFQLLIIGIDIGVEPLEALDFVVGLLTFDPAADDF